MINCEVCKNKLNKIGGSWSTSKYHCDHCGTYYYIKVGALDQIKIPKMARKKYNIK